MINLFRIRVYFSKHDWAGIGRRHRLIAWTDCHGIPRSLVW